MKLCLFDHREEGVSYTRGWRIADDFPSLIALLRWDATPEAERKRACLLLTLSRYGWRFVVRPEAATFYQTQGKSSFVEVFLSLSFFVVSLFLNLLLPCPFHPLPHQHRTQTGGMTLVRAIVCCTWKRYTRTLTRSILSELLYPPAPLVTQKHHALRCAR